MLIDHWPLRGLRLTTPDLELRLPNDEELGALGDVAAEGVHDPDFMPFLVPWTDTTPAQRARSVILYYWKQTGDWELGNWTAQFAVFKGDQVMGVQGISGKNFAITREVSTGSWLGQRFHGHGYGTQMRAAVLEFAFAGLGAESAKSGAIVGNHQSLGVSRKLGYRDDGLERITVQGKLRMEQRVRLDVADWRAPFPIHIDGLVACLPDFGL